MKKQCILQVPNVFPHLLAADVHSRFLYLCQLREVGGWREQSGGVVGPQGRLAEVWQLTQGPGQEEEAWECTTS